MARVSKDYVLQTLRNRGIKYWKVTAAGSSYPLDEMQDEETSLDKSLNQLENTLEQINEGLVTVQASERSKTEKGRGGNTRNGIFEFKVDCRSTAAQQASPITGVENGFSSRLENLMRENGELKAQLLEQEQKHQNALLRKEIEEIKQGDPYTNAAIQALAGYFMKGNQQPAAIAGTPLDETKRKAINSAVKRLLAIDTNLHETLDALASFAENDPGTYSNYVQMLKTQVGA